MRGLFITYPVNYQKNQSGILKKIHCQIDVFNKSGIECSEHLLKSSTLVKDDRILRKLQWIPFLNIWPKWEMSESFEGVDFIYLRKPSTYSSYMIRTLKQAKRQNPKLKVFLEIPTYPYEKEMHIGFKRLFLIKEYLYRNKLKEVVDYITLPSFGKLYSEIFGIKVIDFYNGIDYSTIKLAKHVEHSDEIHMICVANFQPTHAYERVLAGLRDYYKEKHSFKVYFHMVGDGSELSKYREIIKANEIENIAIYGFKTGDELEKLYDIADVAISSLGLYKIENGHISSLKNAEYMAKGLPTVYTGGKNDVPDSCKEFFYCVPNDESAICIEEIIQFYLRLKNEYGDSLNRTVRNRSEGYYDISVSMEPVVNKIKEEVSR